MSDSLDAAMDDLETRASLYHNAGGPHRDHYRRDLTAARAAMRKAAREMGEEYEVRCTFSSAGPSCVYLPHNYAPGDRVRIVRIQGD